MITVQVPTVDGAECLPLIKWDRFRSLVKIRRVRYLLLALLVAAAPFTHASRGGLRGATTTVDSADCAVSDGLLHFFACRVEARLDQAFTVISQGSRRLGSVAGFDACRTEYCAQTFSTEPMWKTLRRKELEDMRARGLKPNKVYRLNGLKNIKPRSIEDPHQSGPDTRWERGRYSQRNGIRNPVFKCAHLPPNDPRPCMD